MYFNYDDFRNITTKMVDFKETIYVLVEGDTEEEYIKLLIETYKSKNLELIIVGKHNASSPEYIKEILEKSEFYDDETAEVFFLFDLDVFINNEVSIKVLKELITDYNVLYSKPNFEFWLVLHQHQSLFNLDTYAMPSDEIKKQLTSHDKRTKVLNGKHITKSGAWELIKNIDIAIERSERFLHDIDSSYDKITLSNYNKILKEKSNITNMHSLCIKLKTSK